VYAMMLDLRFRYGIDVGRMTPGEVAEAWAWWEWADAREVQRGR